MVPSAPIECPERCSHLVQALAAWKIPLDHVPFLMMLNSSSVEASQKLAVVPKSLPNPAIPAPNPTPYRLTPQERFGLAVAPGPVVVAGLQSSSGFGAASLHAIALTGQSGFVIGTAHAWQCCSSCTRDVEREAHGDVVDVDFAPWRKAGHVGHYLVQGPHHSGEACPAERTCMNPCTP